MHQPTTITLPPTTVTPPPITVTASLTGLVTCPSRTVNPTYTTSTQLPSNYTWGCPPGYLCKPPQIDCNFEQNPPADTYYCSPDECVPAPPVPTPTGPGCGPYPTAGGYFNFDPELFGLSFSIFVDGGNYAETCSPTSTWQSHTPSPSTTWQSQAPAPTTTWATEYTVSHWHGTTTAPWHTRRQIVTPLPQVCFE